MTRSTIPEGMVRFAHALVEDAALPLMVFGPAAALWLLATGSVQTDGTADEIRARRSEVSRSGLRLGPAPDL
jgi:hypothetical protein